MTRRARASHAEDSLRVPSPCVSICRIDTDNGVCEGCLRTLDEIARWGTMDDDARRSVYMAIDTRRAQRSARPDVTDTRDQPGRA